MHVCLPQLRHDQVTLSQCLLHIIIYPSLVSSFEVYQQYSAFFQAINKDAKYFRVQDKSQTDPKTCLCTQLHDEVMARQLHVPESGA